MAHLCKRLGEIRKWRLSNDWRVGELRHCRRSIYATLFLDSCEIWAICDCGLEICNFYLNFKFFDAKLGNLYAIDLVICVNLDG